MVLSPQQLMYVCLEMSPPHCVTMFRFIFLVIVLLTLAGTGHFASFHGTRGGWCDPLAVSPLIELELRGKNERVARRETKRLIYKLKVLGQPVTSEVRSSAEK